MLDRLDNWVLDRLFQPLADRGGAECYRIAQWLLQIGVECLCIGLALQILSAPRWWLAALLLVEALLVAGASAWLLSFMRGHRRMMHYGAPSALASRAAWQFARRQVVVLALCQIPVLTTGGAWLPKMFLLLGAAAWIGFVGLISCRRPSPTG